MVSTCPITQRIGTLGSVGHIIPGTVVRLVKEDGTLAGYNEPGELVVKTPSLAMGYYEDEAA